MAKFAAKGTILQIGAGFVPITQMYSLSGPSLSADVADVSEHDFGAPHYREFVNTFRDGGEVSFGLRWDPSDPTHSEAALGLLEVFENDVETDFKIIWPNTQAADWTFKGFVTGYEPTADFDAELDAAITVKVTGKPTFDDKVP